MKKIAIIVGTRPNFIKITQFERVFQNYKDDFDYHLVHTGQHYDYNMSDVFFDELGLKKPNINLDSNGKSVTDQIGDMIAKLGDFFRSWKPDLVIVVGDVNSTLAACIAANKCGCKIAHLESGLRSYDREMPEEINRLVTDAMTDIYFVTEQSGLDNLKKEFNHGEVVFVGNTMIDSLVANEPKIQSSDILNKIGVNEKSYMLTTIHRPSNVDELEPLQKVVNVLKSAAELCEIVFPIHPRTEAKLKNYGLYKDLKNNSNIHFVDPLGYLDFQKLIKDCALVLTDSGGIQEETTFRQVPCLTLRNNTERPSTIEIGSNELVPLNEEILISKIKNILSGNSRKGEIPEYWDGKATDRIVEWLNNNL